MDRDIQILAKHFKIDENDYALLVNSSDALEVGYDTMMKTVILYTDNLNIWIGYFEVKTDSGEFWLPKLEKIKGLSDSLIERINEKASVFLECYSGGFDRQDAIIKERILNKYM